MCTFLKTHATETEEFYESQPGSIFDLGEQAEEPRRVRVVHHAARRPAAVVGVGRPGLREARSALKLVPDVHGPAR